MITDPQNLKRIMNKWATMDRVYGHTIKSGQYLGTKETRREITEVFGAVNLILGRY